MPVILCIFSSSKTIFLVSGGRPVELRGDRYRPDLCIVLLINVIYWCSDGRRVLSTAGSKSVWHSDCVPNAGMFSSLVPWPLSRQRAFSSQSHAVTFSHVGGRPHLSPRGLPFASATKAPNGMGCYSFSDPGGVEGWVGRLIADALPTKWLPVWRCVGKFAGRDQHHNHTYLVPCGNLEFCCPNFKLYFSLFGRVVQTRRLFPRAVEFWSI